MLILEEKRLAQLVAQEDSKKEVSGLNNWINSKNLLNTKSTIKLPKNIAQF